MEFNLFRYSSEKNILLIFIVFSHSVCFYVRTLFSLICIDFRNISFNKVFYFRNIIYLYGEIVNKWISGADWIWGGSIPMNIAALMYILTYTHTYTYIHTPHLNVVTARNPIPLFGHLYNALVVLCAKSTLSTSTLCLVWVFDKISTIVV